MELLVGLLDSVAFVATSRRWLFWLLVALIAVGLVAVAANLMEPDRPSF